MEGSLVPAHLEAVAERHNRLAFGITGRFLLLLAMGLLWLIPAFQHPALSSLILWWDLAVVLLWLLDLLLLPGPSVWRIERRCRGPLQLSSAAPSPVAVEIEAYNGSARRLSAVMLDGVAPPLREQVPVLQISAAPHTSALATYHAIPRERGTLALGPIYLRYRSGLALAERLARAELTQQVTVLPDVSAAQEQALRVIQSRQIEAERRRTRNPAAGREFETLREYRQGDDLRDISWSATARRRQLITRTYTAERSQTVWLLMDAGRLMRARVHQAAGEGTLSKLDYAVSSALAVAEVASRSGDNVGLLAYGRSIQQAAAPARGPEQMRRLIRGLALVTAERTEASHARVVRTLLQRQSRRSLVLWMTDIAETVATPEVIEYAVYLARHHLVLVAAIGQPDLATLADRPPATEADLFRHAAAREVVQRRDLTLRQLRTSGVLAIEVTPDRATTRLVNEYLLIKDRGLL